MPREIPVPLVPSWLRWAGVLAVAAFIFWVSIVTVPPETVVDAGKPAFVDLDEWRHFVAYAVFGFSLAYALVESEWSRAKRAAVVVAIALVYGVGIEFGQSALPRRYFGIDDAIANAIGAALSLLWYAVDRWLRFVPVSRFRSTG